MKFFHTADWQIGMSTATDKWREAYMKELLVEMEEQARYLNSNVNDYQKAAELQDSLF
jgi:DNA repair exonuclease SbcCD nuclease subunit